MLLVMGCARIQRGPRKRTAAAHLTACRQRCVREASGKKLRALRARAIMSGAKQGDEEGFGIAVVAQVVGYGKHVAEVVILEAVAIEELFADEHVRSPP